MWKSDLTNLSNVKLRLSFGLGISLTALAFRTGDFCKVLTNSAERFSGGKLDLVPVRSLRLSLDLLFPLRILALNYSSSFVGDGERDLFREEGRYLALIR